LAAGFCPKNLAFARKFWLCASLGAFWGAKAPSSLARTPVGLRDLFSPFVSAAAAVSVADARGHFLREIMTSPLPASSAAVPSAQSVPRSEN